VVIKVPPYLTCIIILLLANTGSGVAYAVGCMCVCLSCLECWCVVAKCI